MHVANNTTKTVVRRGQWVWLWFVTKDDV